MINKFNGYVLKLSNLDLINIINNNKEYDDIITNRLVSFDEIDKKILQKIKAF